MRTTDSSNPGCTSCGDGNVVLEQLKASCPRAVELRVRLWPTADSRRNCKLREIVAELEDACLPNIYGTDATGLRHVHRLGFNHKYTFDQRNSDSMAASKSGGTVYGVTGKSSVVLFVPELQEFKRSKLCRYYRRRYSVSRLSIRKAVRRFGWR